MVIVTAVNSAETMMLKEGTALPVRLRLLWRPAFEPIALAIFICWLLIVGHFHEQWFDEAQAWLLARDNTPYEIVLHAARYEGTPALWHLVLWVAIRLGLPFSALHLIATTCAIAGAAIVLWRSPFPAPVRAAIIASYFFAYQFSIIGRSYSLDLVLMPLLADFFAARVERPLRYAVVLGLIANANAHGFIASALFGVEWAWRLVATRRPISRGGLFGLAIASVLGVIALLTAWQPSDNVFLQTFPPPRQGLPALAFYIREALVDRLAPFGTAPPASEAMFNGFLVSLLLLAPCFLLFRRAGHGVLTLALFVTLTAFSVWKYGYGWHAGLLFLVWLVCLWISWPAAHADAAVRRIVIFAMYAVLLPQAAEAMTTGLEELDHAFSAGPQVAKDVTSWRDSHRGGRIAAFGLNVFAVQPWFPHNLFVNYHDGATRPSYIRWNRSEPWKATVTDADWQRALASKPDMILLSLADSSPTRTRFLAQSAHTAGFGPLHIYSASSIWKGYDLADDRLGMVVRTR